MASIRTRFNLLNAGLLVFLAVSIGIGSYLLLQHTVREEKVRYLRTVSAFQASKVSSQLEKLAETAGRIASSRQIDAYQRYFQEHMLTAFFAGYRDVFPFLAYIDNEWFEDLVVLRGEFFDTQRSVRTMDVVQAAIETPNRVVMRYHERIDRLGGPGIFFAVVMIDYFDRQHGCLLAAVPLRRLKDELGSDAVGRTGTTVLLGPEGRGLAWVPEEPADPEHLEKRFPMPTGPAVSGLMEIDLNGTPGYGLQTPLANIPLSLLVFMPAAEFWAPKTHMMVTVAVITLFILLFSLFVGRRFSSTLTQPVLDLLQGTEAAADLDFAHPVTVRSTDEIGRLSAQFNRMLDSLRTAREQLDATHGYLNQIVRSMQECLIILDARGHITMANPAASALLGRSEAALVGGHIDDVAIFPEISFSGAGPCTISQIEARFLGESVAASVHAGHVPVLLAVSRLAGERGEPSGWVILASDISSLKASEAERRKLEKQMIAVQKKEAIATLSGGIAHEFNNILGIILGNAELALDDLPRVHSAHGNLQEIKSACLRAKAIVLQLLKVSHKIDLKKETLEVAAVLHRSVQLLQTGLPISISVVSDIDDALGYLQADATQIQEALMHLYSNATHAMEREGGVIRIRAHLISGVAVAADGPSDGKAKKWVQITISDSGSGIDDRIKDRIFDPYFSTKDIGEGIGMGLSVVKGIVHGYRGHITVASELGVGTTVTVLFPVTCERTVEPAPQVVFPTRGTERILFLDDEPSLISAGSAFLNRLGYRVTGQTDPLKALEMIRSAPETVDLVVSDVTMPQMTGDEFVEGLLKIRPDIPVILCSGFSQRVDAVRAGHLGAAAYLEKPLDFRELAATIRRILDG